MKTLLLSAVLAAATLSPYSLDLARYFPSPVAEQVERNSLEARAEAFIKQPAASLDNAEALYTWLATYDSLSQGLRMHDLYVYVRAEEDTSDKADASADDALSGLSDRVDDAARTGLEALGPERLHRYIQAYPALAPYRYFVDTVLSDAAHESKDKAAVTELATPALATLGSAYQSLRRRVLAAPAVTTSPAQAYAARWEPYLKEEDAFAALLLPIASLHNGVAKLEGFADAPDQTYTRMGLSTAQVRGALAAIRDTRAGMDYAQVLARASSARLHVPVAGLHAWDLAAADGYQPPPTAFPDAVPLVLAAVAPMGEGYADQYRKLFDPAAHRVDWCHTAACDDAGFSLGYAGMTSALFYGAYHGATDDMRAVAHEAGHAVHREFMAEHQPLSMYNDGPKFMFESFAIFNEMLFLDSLYRTASTPAAKAYYLHQLVDDMVFQVYGSAEETDLEASIYAGVADGSLRTAKDLDDLTLKVFGRYSVAPALQPEMRVYWARNRLFYADPLYDVNYLFAGLLALQYLRRFEQDPQGFSKRYVVLLKNGFDDTPQALEKKFLGIDLDDSASLVKDAAGIIDKRTAGLESLYEAVGK